MTKQQQEAKPPRRHNRGNKGVGNMMPNAENNSSLAASFITFFHYFTALPLQDLTSNGRSISATTGSVD
ncbi:MAG TPA: hypothetical protein PLD80_07635 [Rugosibacter sp.]|nr:hypothetical protein [Rugosibacter sp.]HQN45530.1 hypothetical protein [Rugosibacter sp.]